MVLESQLPYKIVNLLFTITRHIRERTEALAKQKFARNVAQAIPDAVDQLKASRPGPATLNPNPEGRPRLSWWVSGGSR